MIVCHVYGDRATGLRASQRKRCGKILGNLRWLTDNISREKARSLQVAIFWLEVYQ